MPGFIRITLLVFCIVVGLGFAVVVAIQPVAKSISRKSDKHAPNPPGSNRIGLSLDADPAIAPDRYRSDSPESHRIEQSLSDIRAATIAPAVPSWRVPHRPVFADQSQMLAQIMNRLDEVSKTSEPRALPADAPAPTTELIKDEAAVPEPIERPTANDNGEKAEIRRNEGDDRLTLNIQQSDIRKVLELLSDGGNLNILASKNVSGTVTASLTNVDIQTALEAILKSTGYVARREKNFIYVGTQDDFKLMDQTADEIGTRIYRPNYVKATDIESLITTLLSQEGKITVSKAAQVDIPVDKTKTGGDSFASNEVVIVRDYEKVLSQIDEIVAEIDRKPTQVAIEAVILSVRLNDSHRLGVDFAALLDKENVRLISGSPLGNLGALDPTSGGLKFGFLDSSLGVFVDALESVGDTNVVASPRLMCLNKQRAEILIGSEFGYISTTTVTENAATQAIDFLKVGTHLIFRPFISDDGTIRLEVHPELSTGNVRVVQGLTLPDKETTEVTTNIMCPDGCSVILGGLIREDVADTISQVPLLGSVPVIGAIFRRKTETLERREIVVVITPHIVCEPEMGLEGEKAINEFEQRTALFKDKMSPTIKRHIGERYLRLARSAWNAGDAETAFRYVNLAVHYNPLSQASVNLRTEIVSAYPEFDQNINTRLTEGLVPPHYPHRNYTRQGYPWKPNHSHPATVVAPVEVQDVYDPPRPIRR